ncbi:alcohol dehydrogenase [Oceanicola sp. 22II-s10i]|uniref:zinc-binding dehydrogenase n=1 Tax=Oceanicola sp. 22II-s10i TaxID=1317116 RepID=UPI000B521A12|nr:zinc-binding dehydrogenase [Oceanicola sp. 22II-s10i]OWU85703.1 alcohol dehydrogenase [Oceanicola sp. 22II-s10i]
MQAKAVILRELARPAPYAESKPLSVEDVTLLPPAPTDLVVKVIGGGLCHSDLSIINGSRGTPLPMALGHEGAGEVVEVGSAIMDIKVGDPLVFQFSVSCGRCRNCQSGRPQICEEAPKARAKGELISGGSRIRGDGGEVIRHHAGLSCFSNYVVVNRGSVVKIDDSISMDDAAIFGCAVMTGVGAMLNTANIRPGQSVAVFGLGGVGLCGLLGARAAGAGTIIACDVDDRKLAKAKGMGATHTFNAADPELKTKVMDLTGGGVDVAVELAGVVKAMEAAYSVAVRGGRVVTAGLPPTGAKFAFEQGDLVSNEKSILGSYMGSCVPVRDIPRFLAMYRAGALPVDGLIDRKIGYDEINEGFDRLASGDALRQILVPHG